MLHRETRWVGSRYFAKSESLFQSFPSTDGTYSRENLFHRIVRAWAWAIGCAAHDMSGLVHACQDKLSGQVYQCLNRRFPDSLKPVVYAMSYLCKAYSKAQELGQGFAVFTTSRV
ncbi:hypothetical protein C1Y20_33130 [Pseudomonas sp. FW301-21B01]|nr:hypothetical protein C1Y20_33130 [Pseudomonas sp. FW301-21B01]PNA68426.1 hypothetical protein C1Y14_14110 [Pseudomonas sp. MPR-R5B]